MKHKILLILCLFLFMSLTPLSLDLSLKSSSVDLSIESNFTSARSIIYTTKCNETRVIGGSRRRCCRRVRRCSGSGENRRCRRVCVQRCWDARCWGSWYEYKADTTECNPVIKRRWCESVHNERSCRIGSCENESCRAECDSWKVCEDCGTWQIAVRAQGEITYTEEICEIESITDPIISCNIKDCHIINCRVEGCEIEKDADNNPTGNIINCRAEGCEISPNCRTENCKIDYTFQGIAQECDIENCQIEAVTLIKDCRVEGCEIEKDADNNPTGNIINCRVEGCEKTYALNECTIKENCPLTDCIVRNCIINCTQIGCEIKDCEVPATTTEEEYVDGIKQEVITACGILECTEEERTKIVGEGCEANIAGFIKPNCICVGPCIEKPNHPKYFNNPNNPPVVHPSNFNPKELLDAIRDGNVKIGDPNNIFLPVKLDWRDVRGWIGGWWEKLAANGWFSRKCTTANRGRCPHIDAWVPRWERYERAQCIHIREVKIRGRMRNCQALADIRYYRQRIRDYPGKRDYYNTKIDLIKENRLIINEYHVVTEYMGEVAKINEIRKNGLVYSPARGLQPHRLGESEIIVPIPFCPCFFRSNETYQWKVRYCCRENHECGPWSSEVDGQDIHGNPITIPWGDPWEFITNHTPEPISPVDPDWAGKEFISNQPLKTKLEWCDVYFEREVGGVMKDTPPELFELYFYILKNKNIEPVDHPYTPKGDPASLPTSPRPLRGPEDLPDPFLINVAYKTFFTPPPFIYKGIEYNLYAWRVRACKDWRGKECTDFSQKWRFAIYGDAEIGIPDLISPPNEPNIPIGFPIEFKWGPALGAHIYDFEIWRHDGINVYPSEIIRNIHSLNKNYNELYLNSTYHWRVRACGGLDGADCGAWSDANTFKTTGRTPTLVSPIADATDILIPTLLDWEDVPGSASYRYKIYCAIPVAGPIPLVEGVIKSSETLISYDKLEMGKSYNWFVKTCADEAGTICGDWSSPQSFTSFVLTAPTNLYPENNTTIYTYQLPETLSWDKVRGAGNYKINITKPDGTIIEKIISETSFHIPFRYLGTYQWQVMACLDRDCTYHGVWGGPQGFEIKAKEAPEGWAAGLIPCGRRFDNPGTPWCETVPCEIRHLFIVLYNIIDFALWRLIPLILISLVVYTGAMFYLSISTEETEPISKAKALWRSAGIGFGFIFLSWFIITWILWLFGYQLAFWHHIVI